MQAMRDRYNAEMRPRSGGAAHRAERRSEGALKADLAAQRQSVEDLPCPQTRRWCCSRTSTVQKATSPLVRRMVNRWRAARASQRHRMNPAIEPTFPAPARPAQLALGSSWARSGLAAVALSILIDAGLRPNIERP